MTIMLGAREARKKFSELLDVWVMVGKLLSLNVLVTMVAVIPVALYEQLVAERDVRFQYWIGFVTGCPICWLKRSSRCESGDQRGKDPRRLITRESVANPSMLRVVLDTNVFISGLFEPFRRKRPGARCLARTAILIGYLTSHHCRNPGGIKLSTYP